MAYLHVMLCEQDQSLHLGNIFPPACKLQTGVVVKYSDHINVTDVRAVCLCESIKWVPKYWVSNDFGYHT